MQLDALQIALRLQFNRYLYQLVNDYVPAEVMPASVLAALYSRAPGQLHFRHTVSYSFSWIASPAARDCLSWHWISWRLLPLKPMLNDYSLCVVI